MEKIISVDAETNGLWGSAFSIGAVLQKDDGTIEEFVSRCPIKGSVNPWTKKNVLPYMEDIKEDAFTYEDMLYKFSTWYLQNKEDATIIVHVGFPVETKVFRDMHTLKQIGDWDAPFPLVDISALPQIGISVDEYIRKHRLTFPFVGTVHNPLYDAHAALAAYNHVSKSF